MTEKAGGIRTRGEIQEVRKDVVFTVLPQWDGGKNVVPIPSDLFEDPHRTLTQFIRFTVEVNVDAESPDDLEPSGVSVYEEA
jgi:hypothetical protein